MPFHIVCPECKFPFVLGDDAAEQTIACSNCGHELAVPALPPAPIEITENYRQVLGERPPLFLQALGIYTSWSSPSNAGDWLRCIWGFRFVVLLLIVILFTVGYTTSRETAVAAAPWFTLVFLGCVVAGYALAVYIAWQEDMPKPYAKWLAALLLDPFVLFVTEFRAALPAVRAVALGLFVLAGGCLVAARAGSLDFLMPELHWPKFAESYAAATPSHPIDMRPSTVPLPPAPDDPPPAPPSSASVQAAATTTMPANAHAGYQPENGPPPPPE